MISQCCKVYTLQYIKKNTPKILTIINTYLVFSLHEISS